MTDGRGIHPGESVFYIFFPTASSRNFSMSMFFDASCMDSVVLKLYKRVELN